MADDLWPYRFKNKQKLQSGTKRTSLLKSKNRTPAKKTWSSNWQKSCIWLRAGLKYFKAMFCFDWRTRPRRQFFSPETKKVASNYKLAEDRATFNQQPNNQKRKSLKCLFWNFWHDLNFFLDRSRGGTSPNFLSPSWARSFKVKPGRASSFSTFNRLGHLSLKIHNVEFDIYVLLGEMIRQNLMLKI